MGSIILKESTKNVPQQRTRYTFVSVSQNDLPCRARENAAQAKGEQTLKSLQDKDQAAPAPDCAPAQAAADEKAKESALVSELHERLAPSGPQPSTHVSPRLAQLWCNATTMHMSVRPSTCPAFRYRNFQGNCKSGRASPASIPLQYSKSLSYPFQTLCAPVQFRLSAVLSHWD